MVGLFWAYQLSRPALDAKLMVGLFWSYQLSRPALDAKLMVGLFWSYQLSRPALDAKLMVGLFWSYQGFSVLRPCIAPQGCPTAPTTLIDHLYWSQGGPLSVEFFQGQRLMPS